MPQHTTITCPICGHSEMETVPADQPLLFYKCQGCGVVLKPKAGACCVFCSYGDRRCATGRALGRST